MNILFISFDYPPLLGGIAEVSYRVAKSLSESEDTLVVIAPAVGEYKEFDNKNNINTIRITNIIIIREIVLFFVMLYSVFKFKIDVIQNLTWYPSAAISYFVSILTKVPYVIYVHAMDYFEDRRGIINKLKYNCIRMFIKRLTFDRAKKITSISYFMKDKLAVRGIDALKIKVVYPGVDSARFVPRIDAKKIITKHGLENKKILLTVSRLDDYKGHDMVIKTLPRLISKFPDIVYLVVGEGPNERSLRKLIDELNLSNYVIFAGWVDDTTIPLYYNACDIFIMLSREVASEAKVEGYGLVFLEANACGKPIIAGRSGGVEDAVIDGVTGILVDPLDLEEIGRAVTKILNDKHYAELLGTNGLGRIKDDGLDWHNVGRKIRVILSEAKK
ncbi:MAG: glycosyltransferase family 4 protein [Candidatus Omnitrophica bacterium]|nr:glycosyltransferase family 4 protein [Candidatus Omnitrophota bacterium]